MSNKSGLSMVEVIISIIILIIIAFFAIFNSQNSIPQAKAAEVYSEMRSVEAAVESIRTNMVMKDDFELVEGKHYDSVAQGKTGYYVINGFLEGNETNAAEFLGLDNLKRNYLVNYETGNFELETPVNINGNSIKTLPEINSLINSGIK